MLSSINRYFITRWYEPVQHALTNAVDGFQLTQQFEFNLQMLQWPILFWQTEQISYQKSVVVNKWWQVWRLMLTSVLNYSDLRLITSTTVLDFQWRHMAVNGKQDWLSALTLVNKDLARRPYTHVRTKWRNEWKDCGFLQWRTPTLQSWLVWRRWWWRRQCTTPSLQSLCGAHQTGNHQPFFPFQDFLLHAAEQSPSPISPLLANQTEKENADRKSQPALFMNRKYFHLASLQSSHPPTHRWTGHL